MGSNRTESVQPGASLLEAELRARAMRSGGVERAIWQLALGETAASLQTLRSLPPPTEPSRYWDQRWIVPVLNGDWERAAAEAGEHLRAFGDRPVAGDREFQATLLSLIAGDETGAREQLDRLRAYVAMRDRFRTGRPSAVAEIAEGLLAGDAARVAIGLDALLEWHLRRTRAGSDYRNSSRGVLCMDAVLILLLADRRGLRVPMAPKFRAATVPLLVIALTEWNGLPLGREVHLSLETDLVAGPWLAAHGLQLQPVASASLVSGRPKGGLRRPTRRSLGAPEVSADVVVGYVRRMLDKSVWPTWHAISAAVMLGQDERARTELVAASEAARRSWQRGRRLHGTDLPHPDKVLEHFGLALITGDDAAMAEMAPMLRAYVGHPSLRPMAGLHPFAVAQGHLLFLGALLDSAAASVTDSHARTVGGPYQIGPACYALYRRDGAALAEHLNSALAEHARKLERRGAPPPALHEEAMHVLAAAERLGVRVEVDPRYFEHPTPVVIRDPPDYNGEIGRLLCDLTGRALWKPGSAGQL